MGFKELRPHQVLPIQRTLQEKDQFVIMPTGSGKSACYIIPTLAGGFRTLILSPLVALIKDQHESMLRRGLRAGAVSSLYTKTENDRTLSEWKRGDLDFLLIAPERLRNDDFMRSVRATPPDMLVVDEIHVASEHAFNFRPDYRKIAPFIAELNPRVFLGLTATFTPEVEQDLRLIFNLPDAVKTASYYPRENLKITSEDWRGDFSLLREIEDVDGSVIVYFSTVKRLTKTFQQLKDRVTGGVCMYHGSMTPAQKDSNQTMFMNSQVRVVFATISFGMGVDKEDIRGVFQVTIPGSVEEITQAFGRGGRDGKDCRCLYFWDQSSYSTQEFFIDMGYPLKSSIVNFYKAVKSVADQNDGLCDLRVGDICKFANVNPIYASAISSILLGEGVLDRDTVETPLRIKPLLTPGTPGQKRYMDRLLELGVRDEHGVYEIDQVFFAEQMSVSENQLLSMLRTMAKSRSIDFEDSGNSKPLRVLKPVEDVDFVNLNERRKAAWDRLRQVREFWETEDSEKHHYLKKYFEAQNR